MGKDLHDGGCFCGGVRYRVTWAPRASFICHCVSCRRAAGAQSVAWLTVSSEDFSLVSSEPAEHRSSPGVTWAFCGGCGTPLTYRHDGDPDTVDVITASLDRSEAFPPTYHVWMEDRVVWEGVDDGLPQFRQDSPAD